MSPPRKGRSRRFLARLFAWPVALLIAFEEWGWEPLQRGLVRLARALGLGWVEARIRALPPYPALALLALPWLALLPVKVGALWLLAHGQRTLGLLVIVVAKVAGTAFVARLFTLTQPALMTLPWFARSYARWIAWKTALLDQLRASFRWARLLRRRWRLWRQGLR